jgi:Pyruvate/2-oxoacid:ferredoxin oxidoreductase gamma subunit
MIEGDLDVLLAFEISEALRNLRYANENTFIITSRNTVIPPSVLTHRSLKINGDKCVGCGNCVAHCIANNVYFESKDKHLFTLVKGPTRVVVNGYNHVLDSCTGCIKCIIDRVCPFGAIEAFNEFEYPEVSYIEQDIKLSSKNVIVLDANKIAIECGNILAANVVLLGVLAGIERIPLSKEIMLETVKRFVPKKALDVNVKAFNRGIKIGLDFK